MTAAHVVNAMDESRSRPSAGSRQHASSRRSRRRSGASEARRSAPGRAPARMANTDSSWSATRSSHRRSLRSRTRCAVGSVPVAPNTVTAQCRSPSSSTTATINTGKLGGPCNMAGGHRIVSHNISKSGGAKARCRDDHTPYAPAATALVSGGSRVDGVGTAAILNVPQPAGIWSRRSPKTRRGGAWGSRARQDRDDRRTTGGRGRDIISRSRACRWESRGHDRIRDSPTPGAAGPPFT